MKSYQLQLTTSHDALIDHGTDKLFRETIYSLVLSVEKLLACRAIFAKVLDLTPSQFAVLMGVASKQQESGVAIKDLAEHLSMAPTHVTTEISRLEAAGLLSKRPNEADGRSILVTLTAMGEERVERISPIVRETNDILFQNIGAKSLANTHAVVNKIVANSAEAVSHAGKMAAKIAREAKANA